jgi:hypothetical protein
MPPTPPTLTPAEEQRSSAEIRTQVRPDARDRAFGRALMIAVLLVCCVLAVLSRF